MSMKGKIKPEIWDHVTGDITPETDNAFQIGKSGNEFKYLKPVANVCHIETGTYTGDGATSKAITTAFDPKYVRIWLVDTAGAGKAVYEKSSDFGSTLASLDIDGDTDIVDNAIIALGTLSFTVDDAGSDAHPNKNTQAYCYLILG